MSHWIERKDINLQMLNDVLETVSSVVELDEDSVVFTNENNLQIYISLDEEDGVLNWFCATKLKEAIEELTISRACKELNDEEGFPCCNLSYDFNDIHGLYAGASTQLSCDKGVALEALIETHKKFENSCVGMFVALSEKGLLEVLEE